MKDVTIADRYKKITVRMCEKHFRSYRDKLDRAMEGGTSYSFTQTTGRGCDICRGKRELNGHQK